MNRFFEKYTEWEDYINGMYDLYDKDNEVLIRKSVLLLKDTSLFLETCNEVINNWNVTTKVHLTNNTINKKAWLGQACCSYKFKVPELLTRVAWGKLNTQQQIDANNVAEKVINSYLINLKNGDNFKLY